MSLTGCNMEAVETLLVLNSDISTGCDEPLEHGDQVLLSSDVHRVV